jgi:hypothetical protein
MPATHMEADWKHIKVKKIYLLLQIHVLPAHTWAKHETYTSIASGASDSS